MYVLHPTKIFMPQKKFPQALETVVKWLSSRTNEEQLKFKLIQLQAARNETKSLSLASLRKFNIINI